MTSHAHGQTLVLNSAFEPIVSISWRRAICLVMGGKAEIIVESGNRCHSPSTSVPIPAIIRVFRYVAVASGYFFQKFNRRNVLLRDGLRCQYCGMIGSSRTLTIDHVTPRSRGGKTNFENCTTACQKCNSKKAAKTPAEAGMKLLSTPKKPGWQSLISKEFAHSLNLLSGVDYVDDGGSKSDEDDT